MNISVSGLKSGYEGTPILNNVNFEVSEGEIVGIVGRNGVGKTTLLKSVMGLIEPDAGTVRYNGADLTSEPADVHAKNGIGYVPQGRDVFPGLSVKQNLIIGEEIGEEVEPRHGLVYDYFPVLKQRADQDAGTLSGGQQQMLAIGRALVNNPDVLLVDEPSEGVQPSIVQSITEDLKQINRDFGTTILFVEQNLSVIQGLADRCYAINRGTIADEISGEDVSNREQLEEYLVI